MVSWKMWNGIKITNFLILKSQHSLIIQISLCNQMIPLKGKRKSDRGRSSRSLIWGARMIQWAIASFENGGAISQASRQPLEAENDSWLKACKKTGTLVLQPCEKKKNSAATWISLKVDSAPLPPYKTQAHRHFNFSPVKTRAKNPTLLCHQGRGSCTPSK